MGQAPGSLQGGARLRYRSAADADRAARTFRKLTRHKLDGWAITGGLAIAFHDPGSAPRALNDIDFVAPAFASLPASLAGDFLFRHVHPQEQPGKIIGQLIDPDTALRIDVFRACGGTLRRASTVELPYGVWLLVSPGDLAARTARLLLDLGHGVPVAAKHADDYSRLAELANPAEVEAAWADHRRATHPPTFGEAQAVLRDLIPAASQLLITPQYSQNTAEICLRCVPTAAFSLADPSVVLALLGYC